MVENRDILARWWSCVGLLGEMWWLVGGHLMAHCVGHTLFRFWASLFGYVGAHSVEIWWLIVRRCGGSLCEDLVAHCLDIWGLTLCRFGGSLFGDLGAHSVEIWWLIVWRCGGSLCGDLVAHCLEMPGLTLWRLKLTKNR